ncbi:MAG TPA: serine/threonine protein kinase [Planctomycetaceae bacterium]|nr:serine/threonine protein kinase [Planctomycetaceae bacterium]
MQERFQAVYDIRNEVSPGIIFVSTTGYSTTGFIESTVTHPNDGQLRSGCSLELIGAYQSMLQEERHQWNEELLFIRQLGSGGQGVVFLSERRGTDNFVLPVAVKVFSPERYGDDRRYARGMEQLAYIAARIAQIQHDNLLDVHSWRSLDDIRVMEMEWVDGLDLNRLLSNDLLGDLNKKLSVDRSRHLEDVVVTRGPIHARLQPGIAIPIIRDCLAGLGALHRENIIHGDVKPANIMIKRTGNVKIVDVGSAFEIENPPANRLFTPAYASPEALKGEELTPRSDLASLGYVLIEMLSGRRLFDSKDAIDKRLQGRLYIAQQLSSILPPTVASSDLLMKFIRGLIAPDPNYRFENAEQADLFKNGAADFLRELVKGDLACEPESELRNWLDDLQEYRLN